MMRAKVEFATHRCDRMPEGFSLRCYEDSGYEFQWPEPGGWVLGRRDCDDEWMTWHLDHVTPWRNEHVRFCPWCGERLEGSDE